MKIRLPWMSRTERKAWQAARTLPDLAQLTAAWWEGTVRALPGHRLGHSPHPLAEHATVLAAANRSGFLIQAAQAGRADGLLQLRAAVQGFATDPVLIRRLVAAAESAGLEVVLHDWLDAELDGPGDGINVTTGNAPVEGAFGQAIDLADLKAMWPKLPHAVNAVAPALQITLADPDFGPSTWLWLVLAEATTRLELPVPAPTVLCGCGCRAIDWQICQNGCRGVTNTADGRCDACIDPSVIIGWSKETDDGENECALCGAPFYSSRPYCSDACETADSPEGDDGPDHSAPAPLPHRPVPVHPSNAPWS
ncbi:DUF6919 domain-containing protein [Streptomyces sp. NBC_01766]|uniref:DUF6919 domain-containing protein n=1 Tax=Streptomyces sp. NBC_01766 TaxID=2975936 RepID=UPI002DD9DBF6|nr:hypothetical protein [Streptomyces sp. NBC_01766]WSC24940.1 hypothetical protein OIE60_35340 [Streptomyces sp. NBC_01766]